MSCLAGSTIPFQCPETGSGDSGTFFLTLINILLASRCQISHKNNYPEDIADIIEPNSSYDFIVIGSGSAGSVVANILTENPHHRVLLLEAGGYPSPDSDIPAVFFSLQDTEHDWKYTTEPSDKYCLGFKGGRCRWPRGKVLGGSSSFNAMLYVRGNRRDYDEWSEMGNTGWSYDEVLPFYQRNEHLSEEYLPNVTSYGRNGDLLLSVYQSKEPFADAIRKSADDLGYPMYSEEVPLGYTEIVQNIEHGVRQNAAKAFLGPIQNRKNLYVSLNSIVDKVLFDETKTRAIGVVATINGRKMKLLARKEVVLSAGAIGTPQILQLSGLGPKKVLLQAGIETIKELPIGMNLQDHLIHFGVFGTIESNGVRQVNTLDEIYKYYVHKTGEFSQISVTNIIGFINTKNDSAYPNIQLFYSLLKQNDEYLLPSYLRGAGFDDKPTKQLLEINKKSNMFSIFPTLLNPESIGDIRIKSSDPMEQPTINPNYFGKVKDEDTMLEAIRFIEKQLDTEPMKKIGAKLINLELEACKDYEFQSDEYWKCSFRQLGTTLYHPVGTCKMAPFEQGGVVDSTLKVYGIDGLRVIDASIMPKIISGNTNAPAMMIGRKGATMMAEEWP